MTKLFLALSCPLICMTFIYMLGAFISLEVNPFLWTVEGRIVATIFWFVACMVCYAMWSVHKETK